MSTPHTERWESHLYSCEACLPFQTMERRQERGRGERGRCRAGGRELLRVGKREQRRMCERKVRQRDWWIKRVGEGGEWERREKGGKGGRWKWREVARGRQIERRKKREKRRVETERGQVGSMPFITQWRSLAEGKCSGYKVVLCCSIVNTFYGFAAWLDVSNIYK